MYNTFMQNIALYLIIGILWGGLVEYLETKKTDRSLSKSFMARLVIILTWPITLFVSIVGFIQRALF
jgi:hypothetical protein